jgi:hypothetical protein
MQEASPFTGPAATAPGRILGLSAAALLILAGCIGTSSPSMESRSQGPAPTRSTVASPQTTSVATTPTPGPESPSATADTGECVSLNLDYVADARGPKGDPIEVARKALSGLQPTDVLTLIDDEEDATIVVVRRGQQIGRMHLLSDSAGGWLLVEAMPCGGQGAT